MAKRTNTRQSRVATREAQKVDNAAMRNVENAVTFARALSADITKTTKGKNSFLTLDDPNARLPAITEWISTGFPELDTITGGGIPVGRMVEYWGKKASGKSAAAAIAIRAVQRMGGIAVCNDYEWSLEPEKLRKLGIDTGGMLYATPSHIEEGQRKFFAVLDQIEKKRPDGPVLFVWDSVGASIPKKLFDQKDDDVSPIAAHAAAMTVLVSKMYHRIGHTRSAVLFINQVRANMQSRGFGPQARTTGGNQYEHGITLSVRFAKIKNLTQGAEKTVCGYRIKCITEKNKIAPPHRAASWELDFTRGPSPELTMLRTLLGVRVITSGGGKYKSPWTKRVLTRDQWADAVLTDTGFRDHAIAEVKKIESDVLTGLCAYKGA